MSASVSARSALRAATSDHHERVDAAFSSANLADRDHYGCFLMAQAAAHLPVEEALAKGGIAGILPDWAARERGALLRADLAALGRTSPESDATLAFDDPAAMLGAVYVLEGSRLGGALLKRSVPADFPTAFLGASDSAAWRRLMAVLDERLDTDAARLIAINAAAQVFTLFERKARQFLKVT
ncbi:biliverdin-producing heme oxygenase [Sphingomonas sp. SUN019]|uniref:biliverdin-producing heme oxygenase n=1 Tax=Sphingomonas sp. SUN019 TaxID=2937788 RepID=UPI002164E722|nr:biliverdin-producing heme oxygenase [Sphingomonas sp. SUN019]UVO50259.1 biliverdin-producing heme oxygenase [Sphingomonas sp. SUN019]